MKSAPLIFLACILLPVPAFSEQPAARQPAEDTLILRNGDVRTGKILGMDDQNFRIEIRRGGVLAGSATLPRSQVESIELGANPERDAFLAGTGPKDVASSARIWGANKKFLSIPRSDASRIGRLHAERLLESKNEKLMNEALAVFGEIEAAAWDSEEREKAREGRLRALISLGRGGEALVEAREIEQTAEDPSLVIQAKFILATAAQKEHDDLVAANPRWEQDVFVRPEIRRLFNEALDLYLYPALFHGSESEPAARGLLAGAKVLQQAGDYGKAREMLDDLTEFYPNSTSAGEARTLLASLPQPTPPPQSAPAATSKAEKKKSDKTPEPGEKKSDGKKKSAKQEASPSPKKSPSKKDSEKSKSTDTKTKKTDS